jgi:hypothetical protein
MGQMLPAKAVPSFRWTLPGEPSLEVALSQTLHRAESLPSSIF